MPHLSSQLLFQLLPKLPFYLSFSYQPIMLCMCPQCRMLYASYLVSTAIQTTIRFCGVFLMIKRDATFSPTTFLSVILLSANYRLYVSMVQNTSCLTSHLNCHSICHLLLCHLRDDQERCNFFSDGRKQETLDCLISCKEKEKREREQKRILC